MIDTVVKLGGSLESSGHAPALLAELERLVAEGHSLLVVPGGGRFADAVRADPELSADPDRAHWAAIEAMDTMAGALKHLSESAVLVVGAAAAQAALTARRLPILAPATWLRAADPLPHSWDVTSDSIAAWVAGEMSARQLVLLKAVEPVPAAAAPDQPAGLRAGPDDLARLAREGVVDVYLPRALPPAVACWVVDGREVERLRAVFAAPASLTRL